VRRTLARAWSSPCSAINPKTGEPNFGVGLEQRIYGFGQRGYADVGQVGGGFCVVSAVFRIGMNEDGEHSQVSAELDVGKRIADHGAGFGRDFRKFRNSMVEEAGKRLATVALFFVVGADVEAIDLCVVGLEQGLQAGVDGVDVGDGVESASDAALIGDNDHAQAGLIETGDGFGCFWEQKKFIPGCYVFSFRHFFVEDAVAIEKDGVEDASNGAVAGTDHPVMIATGTCGSCSAETLAGGSQRLGCALRQEKCARMLLSVHAAEKSHRLNNRPPDAEK
jgi:hypothetical protein